MDRARAQRGFTLVEIMMATAILGVLASIAVPVFQKHALRAKTTERTIVMQHIRRSIEDYYARHGTSVPAGSPLVAGVNPPGPLSATKRPMSSSAASWSVYLPPAQGGLEGSVYYRYSFTVLESPEAAAFTILAEGDLDGDSLPSYKRLTFTRVSGVYQILPGGEFPPAGREDDVTFGTF